MKVITKKGFEKVDIILQAETKDEEGMLKYMANLQNATPAGPVGIKGSLDIPAEAMFKVYPDDDDDVLEKGQIKLSILKKKTLSSC